MSPSFFAWLDRLKGLPSLLLLPDSICFEGKFCEQILSEQKGEQEGEKERSDKKHVLLVIWVDDSWMTTVLSFTPSQGEK